MRPFVSALLALATAALVPFSLGAQPATLPAPSPGVASDAPLSWTGRWQSCWPDGCAIFDLVQRGNRVTGTYPLYEGTIEGTVEGRVLRGTWREPDDGGDILFTLAPDEQTFFGRDDVGDWWNGGRLPATPSGVLAPRLDDPREALRYFLMGMNSVRARGLEHYATALPTLTFAADDEPPMPWDRVERAGVLHHVLDRLTIRIYDLPRGDLGAAADTTVVLEQAGTGNTFPLRFLRDGAGRWQIAVPPRDSLDRALARLLAARGLAQLLPEEHFELRHPRATMRTFIESFDAWDDGGRERVLATLDLSRVEPAVRAQEAPLLADYLRQVLLRAGPLIWQQIPDDPESAAPYVHFVHPRGRVVVAPAADEDGVTRWRFTPETLSHLRDLYDAIDEMPLAEGAEDTARRSLFFRLRDAVRQASPVLVRRTGLLENWQWIGIGVLVGLGALAAAAAGALASLGARRGAVGSVSDTRRRLAWPFRLAAFGGVLLAGVAGLGLPEALFTPLRATAVVALIAGAVGAAFVATNVLAARLLHRSGGGFVFDDILISLVAGTVKIVLAVAGVLLIADAMALPYQSVLAGIGIGGLAFAIAAQDTVANFFGSAVIMADRPFRKGDLVRVQGIEGIVEHVGLRSTQLRTLDDSVVIIPNGQLAKETVDNRGRRRARRFEVVMGLTYETPPEALEAFAEAVAARVAALPDADAERIQCGVWAFAASSIDVRLVCFAEVATPADELRFRHALLTALARLAAERGVNFAYPTQTLHVEGLPAALAARGGDGAAGHPTGTMSGRLK